MTIGQQLTDLNTAKIAIKTAIEEKGVTVGNAPLLDYATKIADIQTSSSYGYAGKQSPINFEFN